MPAEPLSAPAKLTWSSFLFCRLDFVIPVTVEAVRFQIDFCELFVGYFDSRRVWAFVEFSANS